jgi:ubiquinone biosynthesis monooxygenase Coq7
MACTVAVEETIDQHYRAQEAALDTGEAALKATIADFRAEELEHRDAGLAHGAETAIAYPILHRAISTATRTAIWLSERI